MLLQLQLLAHYLLQNITRADSSEIKKPLIERLFYALRSGSGLFEGRLLFWRWLAVLQYTLNHRFVLVP